MNLIKKTFAFAAILFAVSTPGFGQWQTQELKLVPGWNAVYLHVDSMHSGIAALASGTPVEEVWLWKPELTTAQYVINPDTPSDTKTRWKSWKDLLGDNSSALSKMPGNAAYLVKLGGNADYSWNIKGKPVPAYYQWTTSGLNFFGVPSVEGDGAPSLENYFNPAGDLLRVTDIFEYGGGELSASNPGQVFGVRTTKADRGKAFWMRSETEFNRYFGPFDLKLQSSGGVDFGENISTYRLRLGNLTDQALTVTLTGVESETPPSGQAAITGPVPVIIRGALDTATLTYGHAALSGGAQSWTLEPLGVAGSDVEVVLGLDRSAMTAAAGSLYASVLRFTDSLGHSQRDIAVSGTVGSSEGLWVGGVSIDKVRNTMKVVDPDDSTRSVSADTSTYGDVASPYPLRLIIHREHIGGVQVVSPGATVFGDVTTVAVQSTSRKIYAGEVISFSGGASLTLTANAPVNSIQLTGTVSGGNIGQTDTGQTDRLKLMQRAYVGVLTNDEPGVATRESMLNPEMLSSARLISSIHLPESPTNDPWSCIGELAAGQTLSVTVQIDYNDQGSNPFLHTYHPDHDNLSADFETLEPVGTESYTIKRQITLTFSSPAASFSGLTKGGNQLTGSYEEIMTLYGLVGDSQPNEKQFAMRGEFVFHRISDIATLTTE